MINTDINELIKEAIKSQNKVAMQVTKLIKAEFLKAEKEPNFKGWDEASELKLLMKMAAQRKDSISQYVAANRSDLAQEEQKELDYINKFIPEQPSDSEIEMYTKGIIDGKKLLGEEVSMKNMKEILSIVQKKFPTASGKIVSQVVKNNIS